MYEVNEERKESAFDVALVNSKGEMNEFFKFNDDAREKISLSDLIGYQFEEIDAKEKTEIKSAQSGNYSKSAQSGDYSKSAQSGYNSTSAQSGYNSKSAQSGNNSTSAQSGDYSTSVVTGKESISFSCGKFSKIKAVNGTWISLAEYSENTPIYALSGQIGNEDYKDCYGKTLNEKDFYILNNKQFTPVIDYDGWLLIKVRSKMQDDIEIIKCKDFENKQYFCVKKGELTAHGENIKLAMEDLLYKELEERNINEVVEKIKQSRVVTRVDYRIITGACRSGTEEFCKEKGIEDFEEIKLDELLKILDDKYFGAKEFKNLFK